MWTGLSKLHPAVFWSTSFFANDRRQAAHCRVRGFITRGDIVFRERTVVSGVVFCQRIPHHGVICVVRSVDTASPGVAELRATERRSRRRFCPLLLSAADAVTASVTRCGRLYLRPVHSPHAATAKRHLVNDNSLGHDHQQPPT